MTRGPVWHTRVGKVLLMGMAVGLTLPAAAVRAQHASGDVAIARPIPAPMVLPTSMEQAVARGTRTRSGAPGGAYWQQWAGYEIRAALDPATGRLDGSVRIRYANESPYPLRRLVLHLHQNIHAPGVMRNEPQEVTGGVTLGRVAVDSVEVVEGSVGDGAAYHVEGTLMTISPPVPVESGDTVTLDLEWSEVLPQRGAGRMGQSDHEVYLVAYWFPRMGVFDDLRGWDAQPYLGGAEFYDDFGDYDVALTVPAGWTVMGTGELVNPTEVYSSQTLDRLEAASTSDERVVVASLPDLRAGSVTTAGVDGELTYRFTAKNVRDFTWTTSNVQQWDATSARVPDRDGDGTADRVLINSFWRPGRAPLWSEQWKYGKHSIEHHSRYTGLSYPWPHMTSVEGADIIEGGMEFPMLTLIGAYEGQQAAALYYVTAHELAHMWIPMIVGTNEKRYAWMDEGSTTFLEDQARMEYFPGVDHHRVEARGYLGAARAAMEQSMMRHGDWYEPGPGYGVASYPKPATLMAALRDLLGAETWERGYRTFIDEWAFKHPTPWDFFNTFERVADQDLDWFWTSFYDETWTLDHAVVSVVTRPSGDIVVKVADEGFAPYPARLLIQTTGEGTIEREIPVTRWLSGHTTAEIVLPASVGTVTRVEIDPSGYAPDVDRTNNFWPRG